MASAYNQYDDNGQSGMHQAAGGMGFMVWMGADFALDYAYVKMRDHLEKPGGFSGLNPGLIKGMDSAKKHGPFNMGATVRKWRGQAPKNTKGRVDKFLNNYYDTKYEQNVSRANSTLAEGQKAAKLMGRSEFKGAAHSAYAKTQGMRRIYRLAQLSQTAMLAPMLFGMTYHGFRGIQKLGMQLGRPELGGHLTFSALAATDRQRTLQGLANSEFAARRALGNEAALYHQ
jgi:hypothetical protein